MAQKKILLCINFKRLLVFHFKGLFYTFSGDGVILEGNIKGRSRFSVTDKSHSKVEITWYQMIIFQMFAECQIL